MTPGKQPQPGAIWTVDFGNPIGHEQGFRRPALVLSDRRLNTFNLVMVCPLTSTRRDWPVHIKVAPGASGLSKINYVQTEQLRTISHDRLIASLGAINDSTLLQVQRLIATLLDLPPTQ